MSRPLGRPRTRYCDCGEYIGTLRRVLICDSCRALDGWTDLERAVTAELRLGDCTVTQLAEATGHQRQSIQEYLNRLMTKGTVARTRIRQDYVYRFGRNWDTTHCDIPSVNPVRYAWLDGRDLPYIGPWSGRVISGPLSDAKFPGKRFATREQAANHYAKTFRIVEEIRVQAPRYIFRVENYDDSKQDY